VPGGETGGPAPHRIADAVPAPPGPRPRPPFPRREAPGPAGRDAPPEPSEEDRRAARAAAALRRGQPPVRHGREEDEALALAAADPRNGPATRALAWFAWAYNRSPLRALLDLPDLPLLVAEGVLPPLWRRLAFLPLPADRAAAYRRAARDAPCRHSGWAGCAVTLPVWGGLAAVTLWALLASL